MRLLELCLTLPQVAGQQVYDWKWLRWQVIYELAKSRQHAGKNKVKV
jgi:hypothetical protein